MTMSIAIIAGVLVGLLIGGLGGGGSILAVPALVYGLGQGGREATTASLVIVGVSSVIGVLPHLRRGNVRLGSGVLFGVVGVGGSWLGSALGRLVDPDLLLSGFAALLLVVATLMAAKARRLGRPGGGDRGDDRAIGWSVGRVVELVLTASGVGLLTGFFGVGGGFAIVPALTLVLGVSMPVAIGTSLVVIAVNSASAFLFHGAGAGGIDWSVVVPFLIAAVIGALLGGRIMTRIDQRTLTAGFAGFLVLVALYTAARSVPNLF